MLLEVVRERGIRVGYKEAKVRGEAGSVREVDREERSDWWRVVEKVVDGATSSQPKPRFMALPVGPRVPLDCFPASGNCEDLPSVAVCNHDQTPTAIGQSVLRGAYPCMVAVASFVVPSFIVVCLLVYSLTPLTLKTYRTKQVFLSLCILPFGPS